MGEQEAREVWLYFPQTVDGGFHHLRVRTGNGYTFARLDWLTCSRCHLGLVAKVRVTDRWQRRGWGTCMIRRAMREGPHYTWITSRQTPDGQRFFPTVRAASGAAFTTQQRQCAHMKVARSATRGDPRVEPVPGH